MKKINLWAFALVAMLCAGFTSCGGDDDDENGSSGGGTSVATKPFVGSWNIKCNSGQSKEFPDVEVFFFEDSKCYLRYQNSFVGKGGLFKGFKDWKYDKSEKTLSIINAFDDKWAQWLITAESTDTWVGTPLWSSTPQVYTAKKITVTPRYLIDFFLNNFTWSNDKYSIKLRGGGFCVMEGDHYALSVSVLYGKSDGYRSKVDITEDPQNDAIILTNIFWWKDGDPYVYDPSYEVLAKVEIRLFHPYSYSRSYLEVSGFDHSVKTPQDLAVTRFYHD